MSSECSAIDIYNEITNITAYVIEQGICDVGNYPSIYDNNRKIDFQGSNLISKALKDKGYEYIYKQLKENRLFNIKFLDGALLQFMYAFDNNRLKKHRLAFYPSPHLENFGENPENYMKDKLYMEIVGRRIVPFPIRFDFDIEAYQDVKHPKSHLTLGDVENCRIPVSSPLTPYNFLKFILSNFYCTDEYEFISKLPPSKLEFNNTISDNEKLIMYISIPCKR